MVLVLYRNLVSVNYGFEGIRIKDENLHSFPHECVVHDYKIVVLIMGANNREVLDSTGFEFLWG